MKKYNRYTKEILEPVVKESFSFSEVVRKLGKKPIGSITTHVAKRIAKFEIDTSHFLGQRSNCGKSHKGGAKKKSWKEVLVLRNNDRRESAWRLRRAMLEAGLLYKCSICGLDPIWNGKELRLHVDHIDGNYLDCRIENIRFACPNCHTQQETWGNNYGLSGLTDQSKSYQEYRKRKKIKKEQQ